MDLRCVAAKRMLMRAEARKQQQHENSSGHLNQRLNLIGKMWAAWRHDVQTRIRTRHRAGATFASFERRLRAAAWKRWVLGVAAPASNSDLRLQEQARVRAAAVLDISSVLCTTRDSRRCVESMGTLAQLSLPNVYRVGSKAAEMTVARPGEEVEHFARGECLMRSWEYEDAMASFQKRIVDLRTTLDAEVRRDERESIIHNLSAAQRALAGAHYAMHKWDRGLCSSDCAVALGAEVSDPLVTAEGLLCRGEGFLGKDAFKDAQIQFERALAAFQQAGNRRREAHAHRRLGVAYRETIDTRAMSDVHMCRAKEIESELTTLVRSASARLTGLKERLMGQSIGGECKVVAFERVTPECVRMRHEKARHRRGIRLLEKDLPAQREEAQRLKGLEEKILEEIADCAQTAALTKASALVSGALAEYDIDELRARLEERKLTVELESSDEACKLCAMEVRIANHHEMIRVLDELLCIEKGDFMTKVLSRQKFRNVAFNTSNTASNNVAGSRAGGEFIPLVAASEGTSISVFDLSTGMLKVRFAGDVPGRHRGELEGHAKAIQCLAYSGECVVSGGLDAVVHVWNVTTKRRTLSLVGHEASVNSVAAAEQRIFSGSADTTIRIWDQVTGAVLGILRGHKKAVTCLDVGPTWFVSGGAEGHIRVWDIAPKNVSTSTTAVIRMKSRETSALVPEISARMRLRGQQGGSITAVRYGVMEVVSGGSDGSVMVWWLRTGEAIRRCAAHSGPVMQLQFDATRVVSSGADGSVVVCDITTGTILQTLRCDCGRALAAAFDQEVLISALDTGELRSWKWA